jgi:hypothetical protein
MSVVRQSWPWRGCKRQREVFRIIVILFSEIRELVPDMAYHLGCCWRILHSGRTFSGVDSGILCKELRNLEARPDGSLPILDKQQEPELTDVWIE